MKISIRARTLPLVFGLFLIFTMGITANQYAMAFPDPVHKVSEPSVILSGESVTLTIEVSDPPLEHNGSSIRVWNPLNTPVFVNSCPLPDDSNGGLVWELRDNFNPNKVVMYNIPAIEGAKIQVNFGAGETIDIFPSGGATVDGSAAPKSVRWVEINDGFFAPSDNTLQGGPYQFTSCGTVGESAYGGEPAIFEAENPVAGTKLPIDYYSLALAGLYSNVMILPTAAGLLAISLLFFKFKGGMKKVNKD